MLRAFAALLASAVATAACGQVLGLGGLHDRTDGGAGADGAAGDAGDARADGTHPGGDGGNDATVDGRADATADGTFDAPSVGDTGPDAPADAPLDGSQPIDAPGPPDASGISTFLAVAPGESLGPYAAGYGYQLHAFYAQHDMAYWLLYAPQNSATIEAVRWDGSSASPWTSAGVGTINLPSTISVPDGYTFSVAYVDVGGVDIVHIVVNVFTGTSPSTTLHYRATIAAGKISAPAAMSLPKTSGSAAASCVEDGPATQVAADGTVYDVTAWEQRGTECDNNIFKGTKREIGDAGPTTFTADGYLISAPGLSFAHTIVSLGDAGNNTLAVFPDGQFDTSLANFATVGWVYQADFAPSEPNGANYYDAGLELYPKTMPAPPVTSYNDWSACHTADGIVHVVRHLHGAFVAAGGGAFDEQTSNTPGSWDAAAAPPNGISSPPNVGVALVSDQDPAHALGLVTLDTGSRLVLTTSRTPGVWSVPSPIPDAITTQKSSVVGMGCNSPKPLIFWVEQTGASHQIRGADLTTLLQ